MESKITGSNKNFKKIKNYIINIMFSGFSFLMASSNWKSFLNLCLQKKDWLLYRNLLADIFAEEMKWIGQQLWMLHISQRKLTLRKIKQYKWIVISESDQYIVHLFGRPILSVVFPQHLEIMLFGIVPAHHHLYKLSARKLERKKDKQFSRKIINNTITQLET